MAEKDITAIIIENIEKGKTFLIDYDQFPHLPYPCPHSEDCEEYHDDEGSGYCQGVDCPNEGKWHIQLASRHSEKYPRRAVLVQLTTSEEIKDRIENVVKEGDDGGKTQ